MNKINIKLKKFILYLFIVCISLSSLFFNELKVYATTKKEVVLGGDSIGLKLETGVYIIGKYEVETKSGKITPWKQSDIENGDKIIALDGISINNNHKLTNVVNNINDEKVIITLQRDNYHFDTNIQIVISKNGQKSLGLYVRDQLLGVGTLTFFDPVTYRFASLGHGIYDDKLLIGDVAGKLMVSKIESIKKAEPREPGEKRAVIKNENLGTIWQNNATGVYGIIDARKWNKQQILIETANQNEIKLGKAEIYTVIKQNKIEKFEVEIIDVNKQSTRNIKGICLKITDKQLLMSTGGIIQGMSGSPIVQNNKLIGAVSHVMIDNPSIGYGVHIEWMLKDCFDY